MSVASTRLFSFIPASLVLLGMLALPSCHSVDLSSYPASSRQIFLFNFTNRSFEPDVNRELYHAVKAELLRRGNFFVTKDEKRSALRLYGDVVAFQKRGLTYDNLRNPVHIRYSMVCRIKLFDAAQTQLISRELIAHVNFSETEGGKENPGQARLRLARILAADVANLLEREFVNRNKAD